MKHATGRFEAVAVLTLLLLSTVTSVSGKATLRSSSLKPLSRTNHGDSSLHEHVMRRLQQASASSSASAGGATASAGGTSASSGGSSASSGGSGSATTSTSTSGGSASASASATFLNLKPTPPSAPSSPSASSSSSSASSSSSTSPTSPSSPSGTTPSSPSSEVNKIFTTIEEALQAFPELSTFLKLVQEVLGDKISDISTILTLLAPTDAAFEALASTLEQTVDELLSIPIIKQIILYHLIPEFLEIAEFAVGEFIQTLLQNSLGIKVDVVQAITQILPTGGPPANVILSDIKAGEAILHILSGVLIPTSEVAALETLLQGAAGIVSAAAPDLSAGGK